MNFITLSKKIIPSFVFILISSILITKSLNAVVILPPRTSLGNEIGQAFGEGLNRGIQQGFAQAEQQRQMEEQQRRQVEFEATQRERALCNILLQEILENYIPSKHSEYINKISHSNLSHRQKEFIITKLNEVYMDYYTKNKPENKK